MSKHMLLMNLCCPQCGDLLTEGNWVHLDAQVKETKQDGEVRMSAIFGDYSIESDLKIEEGNVVEFRCPKCDASIMLPLTCKQCGAPIDPHQEFVLPVQQQLLTDQQ